MFKPISESIGALQARFGDNFPPGYKEDSDDIECVCEDRECPRFGEPGEVEGHIENCPCKTCHDHYGKISN